MPMGRPVLDWASGREMEGWPVKLNGAAKGKTSALRRGELAHRHLDRVEVGRSAAAACPSPGLRNTSQVSKNCRIGRTTMRRSCTL